MGGLSRGGRGSLDATSFAGRLASPAPRPSRPSSSGSTACGGSGNKAPSDRDWERLARQLQGRLIRPGGAQYEALNRPSNSRYAGVQPQGIAVVAGAEDVRTCILWARDHEVEVVPRAGGHSYSG